MKEQSDLAVGAESLCLLYLQGEEQQKEAIKSVKIKELELVFYYNGTIINE